MRIETAQKPGRPDEVCQRIKWVSHAKSFRRPRHELHQPHRAPGRHGVRVAAGLDLSNRSEQIGVQPITACNCVKHASYWSWRNNWLRSGDPHRQRRQCRRQCDRQPRSRSGPLHAPPTSQAGRQNPHHAERHCAVGDDGRDILGDLELVHIVKLLRNVDRIAGAKTRAF